MLTQEGQHGRIIPGWFIRECHIHDCCKRDIILPKVVSQRFRPKVKGIGIDHGAFIAQATVIAKREVGECRLDEQRDVVQGIIDP